MIGSFGLSGEGEVVYRLMLAQPDWSVEQIADGLGWSCDAVRAALGHLSEQALLRSSRGDDAV
ncbi:hypothetical protein [Streptacidiphilus anmyonensis]|uniref:hypothetical protein n=1 Tax=Streptacidiphilus anmyonensis TaxID=405782 RepID=UPI0005A91D62|nr:hypothetical protein [Streptacidiphilus anmyonensis]